MDKYHVFSRKAARYTKFPLRLCVSALLEKGSDAIISGEELDMNRWFVTALAGAVLAAVPVLAHHSFAAEYDSNAPITVEGTVTKVEWTNPHSYVYVDVKDANGNVVNWAVEGYPPNTLRRTGFTRDLMKQGDVVTINGWRARDGAERNSTRERRLGSRRDSR